jgi:two-component system, NtrC family, sensor histidine kinase KinB
MFNTLKSRILAGFLFVLTLLVGLGGYAVYSLKTLSDVAVGGLNENSELGLAALAMNANLDNLNAAQVAMLGGDFDQPSMNIGEEVSQFFLELQRARDVAKGISPNVRDTVGTVLTQVELTWERYHAAVTEQFMSVVRREPRKASQLYDRELKPSYDRLRALNSSLVELNTEAFQQNRETTRRRAVSATFTVVVVSLIAVALGVIGAVLITRRSIQPLRNLTDTVKQLQAGDLSARAPVTTADEFGDLGYEFNRLTERLEQFEAINISEIVREKQKSEAIIESIEDPLLLFDAEGQLQLMNGAAEDVTGITEQTALGRPLWQLFRDKELLKDIERAIEQAATVRKGEDHTIPPIISIERKGRLRYYRLRVARILSDAPQIRSTAVDVEARPWAAVLVIFNDITHFKELDKMKSDFIAKVSHEFRTPLTSMKMSLDILGEEMLGKLNEEQHDIISTSKQDAARLTKLIRDLLTLARLESAKQTLDQQEESIDLKAATSQLLKSVAPMFSEKGVRLSAAEPDRVLLRMAREHYVSIVSNLLSNALKFTPTSGEVECSVRYDGETRELRIVVSDNGVGIAPEHQKRIFDKFVQVKPTDTSTPGSVGLGLAIISEIVNRYKGRIDLESEPGAGSTFTLRLYVEAIEQALPA